MESVQAKTVLISGAQRPTSGCGGPCVKPTFLQGLVAGLSQAVSCAVAGRCSMSASVSIRDHRQTRAEFHWDP